MTEGVIHAHQSKKSTKSPRRNGPGAHSITYGKKPSPEEQSSGVRKVRNHRSDAQTDNNVSTSKASQRARLMNARPYRSHRFPACARCHKRRSRCTIEAIGEACLLCRLHDVKCSATFNRKNDATRPGFLPLSTAATSDAEEASRVLGPVVSRDTHVLESITSNPNTSENGSLMVGTGPSSTQPVYRSTTIERRPSPPSHRSPQELISELRRLVDPYLTQLVSLYFDQVHPCLPLLHEQTALARFDQPISFNSLFMSNFLAYISFYWSLSATLPKAAQPNQDLAWDTAVSFLNGSFQRCDISAITSAILNVAGRPSKGVVHNTANVARITAFSHSIGLNHDCSDWNLCQSEKDIRSKLWWAVVIHDRWFNFAQGTPPYINREYYNVPLPSLQMLIAEHETSENHTRSAQCYIALCQLTEIVGDVLPLLYHVRSGQEGTSTRQLAQTEIELGRWMVDVPAWIVCKDYERRQQIPGLVNLQLSYLAVDMLLKRLAWYSNAQANLSTDTAQLLQCLVTGENMVHFVRSLQPTELAGFWLPYNVHHFISAETLLLRCALQANNDDFKERSITAARELVRCLRSYHEEHNWDLAEIALPQTESVFRKVEAALREHQRATRTSRICPAIQCSDTETVQTGQPKDGPLKAHATTFDTQFDVEEMFPELFAEFTDGAFWDQALGSPLAEA